MSSLGVLFGPIYTKIFGFSEAENKKIMWDSKKEKLGFKGLFASLTIEYCMLREGGWGFGSVLLLLDRTPHPHFSKNEKRFRRQFTN